MGADIGILSGRTESPYAVGDRIKSVLGPDGPSVVIDCAGFEATMQVGPAAGVGLVNSESSGFRVHALAECRLWLRVAASVWACLGRSAAGSSCGCSSLRGPEQYV